MQWACEGAESVSSERVTSALPARAGISVSDTPEAPGLTAAVYSESTTHFHRTVWNDDLCLANEELHRFGGDEHL